MIKKEVVLVLTEDEINSPEDIEIKLVVQPKEDPEEKIIYTITYAKDQEDN